MICDETEIDHLLRRLFPLCRSLTGAGNAETFAVIQQIVPSLTLSSIPSGSKVFDWEVPSEWTIRDAYIKNADGEKIVDFSKNNLHIVNYSTGFRGVCSEAELLPHLHTLPHKPDWIPYRTSYYKRDWGFCAPHKLLSSDEFRGPFEVFIDADLNPLGNLVYAEAFKQGTSDEEILISTYCCHPSLANDNLSGIITASLLFRYISSFNTRFSYRLAIVPETIGAICFLSRADTSKIVGGTIITTTGGPGNFSIKEAFDNTHWINRLSHQVLREFTRGDYLTYEFIPDGSDERQYSSPAFRIPTPSLHKSKYYEYEEYHTSADNLDFVSAGNLMQTLELYGRWFEAVDAFCYPKRVDPRGEFQLGKRGLYPNLGGTLKQAVHAENALGAENRKFDFGSLVEMRGEHLDAFHWLMHLADGHHSNLDISERSRIPLRTVNEAVALMLQKEVLTI